MARKSATIGVSRATRAFETGFVARVEIAFEAI